MRPSPTMAERPSDKLERNALPKNGGIRKLSSCVFKSSVYYTLANSRPVPSVLLMASPASL